MTYIPGKFGISNLGNASGTTGTVNRGVIFAGGNNITLSQSINGSLATVSIVGGGGGGGGIALANSQTTYTSGTANLVGLGAMTIASTTGQSFNISVPQTSSLSATGLVSISTNGNTISIGASVPGGTNDYYQNMDRGTFTSLATANGTLMLQRLNRENDRFAANITANTVLLNMTVNMTATSLSSSHTMSAYVGLYSDNATNLSLLNSASSSWALAAATSNTANYNGPRWLSFVASQWSSAPNLSQGAEYVFGVLLRSSNYGPPMSYMGENYMHSSQRSGSIGASVATNASMAQGNYWNAMYTVSTTALPTVISANQVNRNNGTAIFMPHIVINNRYSGVF
jgi:hypothetical protein